MYGRSRKEIRETLLAMLQAGVISLPDANYERDIAPEKSPFHKLSFKDRVFRNFKILDELEQYVWSSYGIEKEEYNIEHSQNKEDDDLH
ncbi:MAG: hypothetical protein KH037_12115 [Burkholderiales bacterium]|nr:hypothetical protein [Burkholderiales bacterium]